MEQIEPEHHGRAMAVQRPLFWMVAQSFCRIVTTLAFDLHVYGLEHVPRYGGALLASNHQSYLDPVLLGVRLRRTVSYMARDTLFRNPAFSLLIRNLQAFPVRRGEGDISAIRETIRRLQRGQMLNVFPEGTRTTDGALQPLKQGVALIIKRAAVPVVPAYINGSFYAWPRQHRWPRKYPVQLIYGPAIDMSSMKTNQILPTLQQRLYELRDTLAQKESACKTQFHH